MKIIATLIIGLILISCGPELNNVDQNSTLTIDTLIKSIEKTPSIKIDNDKVLDSLSLINEKDSAANYFIDCIKKYTNQNHTISINDFLILEIPSEDEQIEINQIYTDSFPIYPDDLYCLLLENFNPKSTIDSVSFYSETSSITGFQHSFENDIIYKYNDVESGGITDCIFPTENDSLIRNFFSRYFVDMENHVWYSDTTFGPADEEAGCYIDLIKGEISIAVSIYCGC